MPRERKNSQWKCNGQPGKVTLKSLEAVCAWLNNLHQFQAESFAYLTKLNFSFASGIWSLHFEEHVDKAADQFGGLGLWHESEEISNFVDKILHFGIFALFSKFFAEL